MTQSWSEGLPQPAFAGAELHRCRGRSRVLGPLALPRLPSPGAGWALTSPKPSADGLGWAAVPGRAVAAPVPRAWGLMWTLGPKTTKQPGQDTSQDRPCWRGRGGSQWLRGKVLILRED